MIIWALLIKIAVVDETCVCNAEKYNFEIDVCRPNPIEMK